MCSGVGGTLIGSLAARACMLGGAWNCCVSVAIQTFSSLLRHS